VVWLDLKGVIKRVWAEFGVTVVVGLLWVFAGISMVGALAILADAVVGLGFSNWELSRCLVSVVWAGFFVYLASAVRARYPEAKPSTAVQANVAPKN
jgi:Mg/Co/Ni transporter MgtE